MNRRQKKPDPMEITQEAERRILHGLSLEYDHALLIIDSKATAKIKKPLFRLSATHRQLGAWHPAKKEISISKNLVLFHPWNVVRNVLLHEMAHQLADEFFGAAGEPAHGPTFYKACRLLRADPKASDNDLNSDLKDQQDSSSKQNRLLGRVKKLMALSQSDNPHEAALAMAKANELIINHNLPLLESKHPSCFVSVFLGKPALRHYREDYHLAHLLQEFYFVEGLWISSYALSKGKMGRVLEISGTSTNVEIAAYVYDCVNNYIDRQWEFFSCGRRLGRYRKSDFAVGIIAGFYQKLKTERHHVPLNTSERALILKKDPHLKAYMADRYPHTRTIGSSRAAMHLGIYNKGVAKGKRLSLLRGVAAKRSSKTGLLTLP